MRKFELSVMKAIEKGETVRFRSVPVYNKNNPMPVGVTISDRGVDGFSLDISIPNVNGI